MNDKELHDKLMEEFHQRLVEMRLSEYDIGELMSLDLSNDEIRLLIDRSKE